MNQRIFELAKQADLIHWDTLPSGARTPDHDSVVKAQKFALLIVKECVKCCEEIADINKTYKEVDLVDPEFGPKECIETIKKHFGVEE